MEKVIEKFNVKYLEILDEEGNVDKKLMPKISNSFIKEMYEYLVLTRVFDAKAFNLQRQGRLGTYAPTLGQEACQIGSGLAIKKDDLVFPSFRENGVYMIRGMPIHQLFMFWTGDERGMKIPLEVNMFPVSITVGAHLPHASGAAMAFKYLKKKAASLVYFGDGATSEGDFHTSMNFAGALDAPAVFLCQNNQWAISLPVKNQTASETIAQKAIAYGFEGIRVDGNDVFAVYKATEDALKKARAGGGPTLIECLTYRRADHTTSDDAKKYRKVSEVKKWEKKDPIQRLKKYMIKKKIFSDKYEKDVLKRAEKKIEEAVRKSESSVKYKPGEMFNYMYKNLTPDLVEQQKQAKDEVSPLDELKKDTKTAPKSADGGTGAVGELEEAS